MVSKAQFPTHGAEDDRVYTVRTAMYNCSGCALQKGTPHRRAPSASQAYLQ